MRSFSRVAGGVAVLCLSCLLLSNTEAGANYRFDDLFGPSGMGAQWMVITGGMDTVGDVAAKVPMQVSGDIVSNRNSVVITNGRTEEPLGDEANRDIRAMFLVLTGTQASMKVGFGYSGTDDVVTPDGLVDNLFYSTRKTPLGSGGYDFLFVKNREQGKFNSVRGNFAFHQNPSSSYPSTPSQTLLIPFVIANVADGTAKDNPLLLRAILREPGTTNRGDIAAYDYFTWDVTDNKQTESAQWVFVPVPAWPAPDRIDYRLTTEVTNYTGIRYAVQRYDSYAWTHLVPTYWAFDLPRSQSLKDVPARFRLNELSHIAPGLKTVYSQRFNVNEGNKVPLRLYPVDPAAGFRELILNHRIIFGLDLGTASAPAEGRDPSVWKATAFNPRAASTGFLKNVAKEMDASAVRAPEGRTVTSGVVRNTYVAGDVIASFAIDASIPGSARREGAEGLLPLHITFNLPRKHLLVAPKWEGLLDQWHETGDIKSEFARNFSLYLRSGEENDWNLIQELEKQGYYNKLVKVFLDEERGVITVSFIAMLLDGTGSESRPTLRVVSDRTPTTENDFLVLRDGTSDSRWNLTFYAAPADYKENPSNPTNKNEEKSGGGGCDSLGLGMMGLLVTALLIRKRR